MCGVTTCSQGSEATKLVLNCNDCKALLKKQVAYDQAPSPARDFLFRNLPSENVFDCVLLASWCKLQTSVVPEILLGLYQTLAATSMQS